MSARKTILIIFVLQLSLLTLSLLVQPAQADSDGYVTGAELKVPYTSNPPDITHGVCKADEWKDALVKQMIPFNDDGKDPNYLEIGKGYVLLEYSDKGLYVCGDYVSWTKENFGAGMHIVIDNMHDGIPKPYNTQLKDDVELHAVIGNTSGSSTRIDNHSYTNTPAMRMQFGRLL